MVTKLYNWLCLKFKIFDWKYICVLLLFATGASITYIYQRQIICSIKCFFAFAELNLLVGSISSIITIVHKIKTKKIAFKYSMSFHEFRVPAEDLFSFISNPITIVCSLSLAKGIFLQQSENTKYFPFFDSIDIVFIGLITAYLLITSILELFKNLVEIVRATEKMTSEVNAISEKQFEEGGGQANPPENMLEILKRSKE